MKTSFSYESTNYLYKFFFFNDIRNPIVKDNLRLNSFP